MNKHTILKLVLVTSVAFTSNANALLINFDEFSSQTTLTTYNSLTWNNFNAESFTVTSGYTYGTVSPSSVAYNRGGAPAYISKSDSFNLTSAYLTAVWNNNLVLTVKGFTDVGGTTEKYSSVYTLQTTAPSKITFNWTEIRRVLFSSSGGTSAGYSGEGTQFALDNLCIDCGVSSADTQSSLKTLASRLRSSYNSASLTSNFPNSNTYDCNLFDVKGICISAGGRYSTVDNPSSNSTAAVVTLGYKVSPSIRIGGFLDQSVNNNNPTGINLSNKNPMMGAFAYWNQNPDGLGYQVKIANAYQDKDLSTTRDVIGTSEAGTGKTSLTTQSYVGELSYAFMYKENTLVRPYFALRHTSIEQDAYTETGVSSPLTYSALNDRTTSALMGVKFKHAITEKTKLTGSLGVEQDLHHKTDQLTATGVSGLTSENFSGNIHRTRPVASIGATYDIAKTQRLSGEVLVQQLPFQSTTGATAYFNYMIGF